MPSSLRRWLLVCACLLLWAPPAAAQPCEEWGVVAARLEEDRGIGGTGLEEHRGIGGTGLEEDRGIGGTGLEEDRGIGGTGLFGSISGFGSICVNGIRVHTDAAPQVDVGGEPAELAALAVGQVVWIEARQRDGRLEAQRIEALAAVVGALDAIDLRARTVEVAGQVVLVPVTAELVDVLGRPLDGLGAFAPGQGVEVSGLRLPDGRIEASRLAQGATPRAAGLPELSELLQASPWIRTVSIEGYVSPLGASDGLLMDGLEIETSGLPRAPPVGVRAWLIGDVEDGRVRARHVTRRPDWSEPPLPRPLDTHERPLAAGDHLGLLRAAETPRIDRVVVPGEPAPLPSPIVPLLPEPKPGPAPLPRPPPVRVDPTANLGGAPTELRALEAR